MNQDELFPDLVTPRPDDGSWQDFDKVDPAEQLDVMESWFRAHYEGPAERTPYESAEGGYIYIDGGPYDPAEVLYGEFAHRVSEEVISELADKLTSEMPDWARVPDEDFYEEQYWESLGANRDTLSTFRDATANIETIFASAPQEIADRLYALLFANAITSLETYLFDTFANTVLNNPALLRAFVEKTEEFQHRQVKFSDIFVHAETVPAMAKQFLGSMIWHNIGKVKRMYKETLAIDLGDVAEVGRAVAVRHDIVHRNGRTIDGERIAIRLAEVRNVLRICRTPVETVEKQHYELYRPKTEWDDRELEF
jgi:hypothetical protein